jgi:hypothetical protein
MLQIISALVLLVALENLSAHQLSDVLIPQAVRATLCRALDPQLLVIDRGFGPFPHAGPAASVATWIVGPMCIFT